MARPYTLSKKGYALIYVPGHPWATTKSRQMFRARYIMHVLGRLTDREMVVHHMDRDRLNDHPDNLEVLTRYAHDAIHHAPLPEAQKEKIRRSLLGKKHSAERRKNISDAHKGIRLSEEAKAKVSAAMSGREITWGAKLSKALKGRKPPTQCEEARLKAIRGKPLSEAHKAKLRDKAREQMKRVWAERKAKRHEEKLQDEKGREEEGVLLEADGHGEDAELGRPQAGPLDDEQGLRSLLKE